MSTSAAPIVASERIIFVNRFYRPDHSATAQLLTDLAEHLAADGAAIKVVTSRQCYENAQQRLPKFERLGNVEIHRVWTTRFGRAGLIGRALDYLSFYVCCFFSLLMLVKPGDVLVAKTDPPLLSVIGALVAKLRRAQLVNWLQDLFPEVAKALGVGMLPGPVYSLLLRLRNGSLRVARSNVVLGEAMAKRVNDIVLQPERTVIIPNWVVQADIQSIPHQHNPLRREWQLEDRFVVGYSGNLGRAHEFQTLLDAMLLLRDEPNLCFLFVGGGAQLVPVKTFVEVHRLRNVLFKPYQPIDRLSFSLSAVDAHLVSLQPELEGLILPSKFYGIVAVGRPVIFIGSPSGELAHIIGTQHCGVTIAPGDSQAMAQAILALRDDRVQRRLFSDNSRTLGSTILTRANSIRAWESIIPIGTHKSATEI